MKIHTNTDNDKAYQYRYGVPVLVNVLVQPQIVDDLSGRLAMTIVDR